MILVLGSITKVEERFSKKYVWGSGIGKEAQFNDESLGWWLTIDGNCCLCVGKNKPDLKAGDQIQMAIGKDYTKPIIARESKTDAARVDG